MKLEETARQRRKLSNKELDSLYCTVLLCYIRRMKEMGFGEHVARVRKI